jgi:hypothetical protein
VEPGSAVIRPFMSRAAAVKLSQMGGVLPLVNGTFSSLLVSRLRLSICFVSILLQEFLFNRF